MKIVEDDKVVINIEDEVDKYTFSEFKKARSIIFGRPTDPKATKLTAFDYKVLNFLYRCLQEAMRNDEKLPTTPVILRVPLMAYKLNVDDQSKWKRCLIQSILRLKNVEFELKDYYNHTLERYVSYENTQLLAFPSFYSDNSYSNKMRVRQGLEHDGKRRAVDVSEKGVDFLEVTLPKEIAIACWEKVKKNQTSGYTKVDFSIISKFKNKYSIRLYEALLSKIQNNINHYNYVLDIKLDKDEIANIFYELYHSGRNKNNNRLNLSNMLSNRIHNWNNVLAELKGVLPISDYETNQAKFTITFKLDKDKYDEFVEAKASIYQLEYQKFQDMIEVEKNTWKSKSSIVDASSVMYTLKSEKVSEALQNFMKLLFSEYRDVELLKTDKEKARFGNAVIIENQGFCDKNYMYKPLSKVKSAALAEYLYKHCYKDIMQEIEKRRAKTGILNEEEQKFNPILSAFIGKKATIDNHKESKILSISALEGARIEVEFDLDGFSVFKEFDSVIELAQVLEK